MEPFLHAAFNTCTFLALVKSTIKATDIMKQHELLEWKCPSSRVLGFHSGGSSSAFWEKLFWRAPSWAGSRRGRGHQQEGVRGAGRPCRAPGLQPERNLTASRNFQKDYMDFEWSCFLSLFFQTEHGGQVVGTL